MNYLWRESFWCLHLENLSRQDKAVFVCVQKFLFFGGKGAKLLLVAQLIANKILFHVPSVRGVVGGLDGPVEGKIHVLCRFTCVESWMTKPNSYSNHHEAQGPIFLFRKHW